MDSVKDRVFLSPETFARLGDLVAGSDWEQVRTICSAIADADDAPAEAFYLLAIDAHHREDYASLLTFAQAAMDRDPMCAEYADLLAVAYALLGDLRNSLFCAKLATAATSNSQLRGWLPADLPNLRDAFAKAEEAPLIRRGVQAMVDQDLEAAEHWLRQALRMDPGDTQACLGLVQCLNLQQRFHESVEILRSTRHVRPDDPALASELASALAATGHHFQARFLHAQVAGLGEPDAVRDRDALNDLMDDPGSTSDELVHAVARWAERHGVAEAALTPPPPPTPKNRLTLGYLIGGRAARQIGGPLSTLMANHPLDRFRVVGFGAGQLTDPDNMVFQKACETWHDTTDMDPYTLGAIVTSEGIDILVDVAGFNAPPLLSALASRLAPVQLAWLGSPCGTGLGAVDGRLSDPATAGALSGAEKPVPLASGSLVLVPPLGESRASKARESLTFATDMTLAEMTADTVNLFAGILAACQGSQLALFDHGFKEPAAAEQLIAAFGNYGLAHRLDIIEAATPADFFGEGDIALIPPGTRRLGQVLEALAAGLPVIALAGRNPAQAQLDSLITSLKIDGVVLSGDRASYGDAALALAGDANKLAVLRDSLPKALAASPFFDWRSRAQELETAYQTLWAQACERSRAGG